jgi:hypothetical protein
MRTAIHSRPCGFNYVDNDDAVSSEVVPGVCCSELRTFVMNNMDNMDSMSIRPKYSNAYSVLICTETTTINGLSKEFLHRT